MALTTGTNNQALLDAQLELWHTTFAYIKSMALKSALDLGIADAIHSHGGTATLPQIVSRATPTLHPSKIPCLRRLMRVLTATGIFSAAHHDDAGGELVYRLTPASQLLVGGSSSLTPFMSLVLHGIFVSPFLGLDRHVVPARALRPVPVRDDAWEDCVGPEQTQPCLRPALQPGDGL
jgi:hypothetical protein